MLNQGIEVLQGATHAGTAFIFGYIGGATPPYEVNNATANLVLAFQTLPMIVVLSVLSGLMIYFGILPWILRLMSLLLVNTLKIGGAPGFAIAANAFLGMVEAPLLIRPYLARLSSSEFFMVMVAGMATIAGCRDRPCGAERRGPSAERVVDHAARRDLHQPPADAQHP